VVDVASPGCVRTICEYVHLKLLSPDQQLLDYAWSSYPEHTRRWPWLRVERLFGEMRLPKDSAAVRQEGDGEEWAVIRRG